MNPEDPKNNPPRRLPREAHRRLLRVAKKLTSENQASATYWRGQYCRARQVEVIVGLAALGEWCYGLYGTVRSAVEITTKDETFFIDDPNGAGWLFVTVAKGAFNVPHRVLPVLRIIEKPESIEVDTQPDLLRELDQ